MKNKIWKQVITRQVVVEDACCYQVFVQVQLTLICSVATQQNCLRERDEVERWVRVPWRGGVASFEFVSIVKNGQNKSGIVCHIDFTAEQGVVVAAEVKGHGVWKETHTDNGLFYSSHSHKLRFCLFSLSIHHSEDLCCVATNI